MLSKKTGIPPRRFDTELRGWGRTASQRGKQQPSHMLGKLLPFDGGDPTAMPYIWFYLGPGILVCSRERSTI